MTDDFYEKQDAHPQGVYLVVTYHKKDPDYEQTAIFSTKTRVENYLNKLGENCTSAIVPFIIDEPNFGNIPRDKLQ